MVLGTHNLAGMAQASWLVRNSHTLWELEQVGNSLVLLMLVVVAVEVDTLMA